MRFFEKILILFLAICVSVLGFNLIASSSVCLLTTASAAGYEPLQNSLRMCDANHDQIEFIANTEKLLQSHSKSTQFTHAQHSLPQEMKSNSSRKTQDQ
jgi:hypothetical protein